ncbi:hypothetical protein GGR50DRAFT_558894 [Xylaria sp. CBS 124048]|nr:hypothetical protein GGR50DRAFT_558894 [Xylaria sp. CBS 124048]
MASRKSAVDEAQHEDSLPFRLTRSDGTEIPPEQNQYERVEEGAKAIIEWQNKLGQALAAEVMPEAKSSFHLAEFPAHYHLRWYQAGKDKGTKEDKDKKRAIHYYLFGYPEDTLGAGRARKYYRSPNQFLPHLIWLSGNSPDKDDCSCEFCSGAKSGRSGKAKVAFTYTEEATASPDSGASSATSASNATTNTNGTRSRSKSKPSNSSGSRTRSGSQPSTASQEPGLPEDEDVIVQQQPEPTSSIAAPQMYVAHDHDALFRSGEVVWYKNNNAWRVGMVLHSRLTLSIIPFGHPLYPTQEVVKEEADIRPFLAFSIPQINIALQEFKGLALSQINWEALQVRFGAHTDPARREGLAIEATKLAASRVDQCYSPFNPIQTIQTIPTEPTYTVYGGVFLGAEKICIGEAVRIHQPGEQRDLSVERGMPMVMVIKRIIFVGQCMGTDLGGKLVFEGSLWKLQHANLAQPLRAAEQDRLPATMIGEKRFRDDMLRSRGWGVEWIPVSDNLSVTESTIRGRFYETQRLTPILNPAKFQEMLRQQTVDDIQTLLNNRGDADSPRVGKVRNRAHAVSGAVPLEVLAALNLEVMEE